MKEALKILTVEDETAVTQFLALVLAGPKCKVTCACDGAEALAKISCAARPFDVIITDHKMPRLSGLEFVRQLRARNYSGKVIVLSAHLNPQNMQAYQELHVDAMISKPFDVDELRQAVDVLAIAA